MFISGPVRVRGPLAYTDLPVSFKMHLNKYSSNVSATQAKHLKYKSMSRHGNDTRKGVNKTRQPDKLV